MLKTRAYVHCIDGRLRAKVWEVKRSTEAARRVEKLIEQRDGVQSVSANPLTGNVLVHFDPSRLSGEQVLDILRSHRLLGEARAVPQQRVVMANGLARKVAQELAVSGCVALIRFGVRGVVAALA
jgi:hypothetical protein